jgi:protein-tyrosine phosphatase
MKILMVCLGNICRSPLAQGILEHKIKKHGLDWTVDSAGTGNWHVGELPHHRSIEVAQLNGIDLTTQTCRQVRQQDFEDFDLIVAMDDSNYANLMALQPTAAQKQKIVLMMYFLHPKNTPAVPDPYFDNRFELVYQMLDEACEALIAHYIN